MFQSVLHGRQVARKPVPAFQAVPVPDDSVFEPGLKALADRLDQDQWLQCGDGARVFLLARCEQNADLVFADPFGRRVRTCQRDELLEELARGMARLVEEPVTPAAGARRHSANRAPRRRDCTGARVGDRQD